MAKKISKELNPAHPALLLDKRGITIVGITPQLEWKDVMSIANCKYDPKAKGINLDAIQFMVRGGLKFCVRKEDVVWAEDKSPADTEDLRGLPLCTEETFAQLNLTDMDSLWGKEFDKTSRNLKWAISFGDAIRGKGLALRICEDSLIYELSALFKNYEAEDEYDFIQWFKPLIKQMQNIASGNFKFEGDDFATEKKYLSFGLFALAKMYEYLGDAIYNLDKVNAITPGSPEQKARLSTIFKKSELYQNKAYALFRDARAWTGNWELNIPKTKEDLYNDNDYILPDLSNVELILCSDQPRKFQTLADFKPSKGIIMSKYDIDANNEIRKFYEHPTFLQFPEGHPKNGCAYVKNPENPLVYTELTKTNTGALSAAEAKDILSKLKKTFYKDK